MPNRHNTVKLPTRMNTPIREDSCSAWLTLFGRDLADRFGLRLREKFLRQQAFNDEQGGQRAANGDWQIGHAGSEDRKFSDALVPGDLDQLDAPPKHEEIGCQHAIF